MPTNFTVAKRINITTAKVYLEKGNTVSWKPENKNTLTVYNGGDIKATFTHTQVGVDALVKNGTLVPDEPVAEVKSKEPVEPKTLDPADDTPPAPSDTASEPATPATETVSTDVEKPTPSETSTPVTETAATSTEPTPATDTEADSADVDPVDEKEGDYNTYSKADLLKLAKEKGIVVNENQGQKKIAAAIIAALAPKSEASDASI